MGTPTPYPLKDVIGSILVAMSEAQYESDQYTEELRKEYQKTNDLNLLKLPNAQLKRVEITLPIAVASIDLAKKATAGSKKSKEKSAEQAMSADILVLVTAVDLEAVKPDAITTIQLEVDVDDAEVIALPQKPS